MRRPRAAAAALTLAALAGGCRESAATKGERPAANDQPWFTDAASPSGLTFTHFNGMSGEFYYPEIMPPGVALFDYDNDGDLDVFIVQGQMLGKKTLADALFPPRDPSSLRGRLFRNDLEIHADGSRTLRFTDVTAGSGIDARGYGMGVATGDFDNDGCVDLYVTNLGPNQLFRNNCDGTFTDVTKKSGTAGAGWSVSAALAGAALGANGDAKSSMGVDAGDFDNDGDEDLFITELTGQGVDLYVNNGSGVFEELSARVGLRLVTLPFTGFGTAWLDFDNDGWLDLLTVNGAVTENAAPDARHETFSLRQRKQLFRNTGDGRFEDVSDRAGAIFQVADVGRGAAFGDIDNDGDIDVVVGNASGPPHLLVNNIGQRAHWIGVRLVGGETPRDMVGARVAIARSDGSTLWRRARSDGSYASANDPRVLAGLGDSTKPPTVRVQWPGGRVEEWRAVPVDRYTTLKEGTGMGVSAR